MSRSSTWLICRMPEPVLPTVTLTLIFVLLTASLMPSQNVWFCSGGVGVANGSVLFPSLGSPSLMFSVNGLSDGVTSPETRTLASAARDESIAATTNRQRNGAFGELKQRARFR